MVSGGADSACAAARACPRARRRGRARLARQLRPARRRRRRRGRRPAPLRGAAHRPPRRAAASGLPPGQPAGAPRATIRYDAAERLRERTGAAVIVTGHTRTDVAETALYRLAASPGSRALLGLSPRNGRVDPAAARARARADPRAGRSPPACRSPTTKPTRTPTFARNRIRAEVLPVLRDVNPGAEPNIAETRAELAEEAQLLERVVLEALDEAGAGAGDRRGPRGGARRLGARRCGGSPCGRSPSALRAARSRWGASARPRSCGLPRDPRAGWSSSAAACGAICESDTVRFRAAAVEAAPVPAAVALGLPGLARLGGWEVRAELHPGPVEPGRPRARDARRRARSTAGLEVRTWRHGDRIRPLGMRGTKTLGDLFTDSSVPRSLRATRSRW